MLKFEDLEEKPISTQKIFDGNILHVAVDTVSLPNGNESTREYVTHLGAVGIVPVTDEGEMIIEHQFRYPLHRVITEIPAGKLDSASEEPLAAAKRELLEETGIVADEWIDLGEYHPAAAYCSEKLTLYLAKGLHMGDQKLDTDEFLNIEKVPMADVIEDVLSGKITDGKTVCAVLRAAVQLGYLVKK
ncbi:MAG: NUDIX hydrolase [Lachnospiraceae bacterium]|nr:NUDIX hydrolase [Lachnospiraceae bacterium]